MNETQGLVPGYPESMRNILGNTNIASVHGAFHKRIRGSLLSLVSPHAIKDHLLIRTDQFMRSFIHNWAGQTIDIQDKAKQVYSFMFIIFCIWCNLIPHVFGQRKTNMISYTIIHIHALFKIVKIPIIELMLFQPIKFFYSDVSSISLYIFNVIYSQILRFLLCFRWHSLSQRIRLQMMNQNLSMRHLKLHLTTYIQEQYACQLIFQEPVTTKD